MKKFNQGMAAGLLSLALLPVSLSAQTGAASSTTQTPANAAADNSEKNMLHDGKDGVSADQQGGSKGDMEITRKIRRSLTQNKSLSTYAHNVKIITNNGSVVLKGPVQNQAEKTAIEKAAADVAGSSKVTSEIQVK